MKVINLFAGPGAGKSTNAALVFGALKSRGVNCEYVTEFAKELTWKKSPEREDQIYLFGEQHHRIYTLKGQVEYIITDSPLLLSLHYAGWGNKKLSHVNWRDPFEQLVLTCFNAYQNVNFYIERGDRKYNPSGRNQTEDEARRIDDSIHRMLMHTKTPFKRVKDADEILQQIV